MLSSKAERLAGASLVCRKELRTGLLRWHHVCESSCGSGQARQPWIWLQRRPFQPRLLLPLPHDRQQNHRRQVNPPNRRWMSYQPSGCCRSEPFRPTRCQLASMGAGLKLKEARARWARREEVRVIQAAHHERRLREMKLASLKASYERSGASMARREIQLAELRVALEAAEAEEAAREATPVGIPVAASSANAVEGVLV